MLFDWWTQTWYKEPVFEILPLSVYYNRAKSLPHPDAIGRCWNKISLCFEIGGYKSAYLPRPNHVPSLRHERNTTVSQDNSILMIAAALRLRISCISSMSRRINTRKSTCTKICRQSHLFSKTPLVRSTLPGCTLSRLRWRKLFVQHQATTKIENNIVRQWTWNEQGKSAMYSNLTHKQTLKFNIGNASRTTTWLVK